MPRPAGRASFQADRSGRSEGYRIWHLAAFVRQINLILYILRS
jgi:hypothetical protein